MENLWGIQWEMSKRFRGFLPIESSEGEMRMNMRLNVVGI